jgi:hypothetical protein
MVRLDGLYISNLREEHDKMRGVKNGSRALRTMLEYDKSEKAVKQLHGIIEF